MKNTKLVSIFLALAVLVSSCNTPVETTTVITENALCLEVSKSPNLPASDVQSLAEKNSAESYAFVEKNGAEIIPVDDGKSFAVWWQPDGFDSANDTVLLSLHGHGEFATKDFEVWYPTVKERGYAFVGIQWWFGRSLESNGYYDESQMYDIIQSVLESKGIPAKHVIFQGFSMGGARSYGVTMRDHLCGSGYFAVSIANSGPWEDDYPLYKKVLDGEYGEKPLDSTHWVLFCGGKDINENPSNSALSNVCDGMQATQTRLEQFGAIVDLFIKDQSGDHGSFMKNSENTKKALDVAETIYKQLQ